MKQLFETILNKILAEQSDSAAQDEVTGKESVYTPDQQKFLANFSKHQNNSLGILYSLSPAGIQEFINRSGAIYNVSVDVLIQLIKSNVISIVPYTGYSRNTDYTIKCNVPLEDLKGFETEDDAAQADAGSEGAEMAPSGGDFAGGGGMTTGDLGTDAPADEFGDDIPDAPAGDVGAGADIGGDETPELPADETPEEIPDTGPEESFRKNGKLIFESAELVHTYYTYPQILLETANVAKKLLTEQRGNETFKRRVAKSRVLNRLPAGYLSLLEKIIKNLSGKVHNSLEKEHLVADILDNLAHNFGLTPNQILRSYTFYRNQNKLQNLVKK